MDEKPIYPTDAIWNLLWKYIANENIDEDYSAEMAEELCTEVLPKVWDYVLELDCNGTGEKQEGKR